MANAPAPINVSVAQGAGITADLDIFLDFDHPFVLGTPFLDWTQHPALGAVPARASVPHHRLVAHFLLRHERVESPLLTSLHLTIIPRLLPTLSPPRGHAG